MWFFNSKWEPQKIHVFRCQNPTIITCQVLGFDWGWKAKCWKACRGIAALCHITRAQEQGGFLILIHFQTSLEMKILWGVSSMHQRGKLLWFRRVNDVKWEWSKNWRSERAGGSIHPKVEHVSETLRKRGIPKQERPSLSRLWYNGPKGVQRFYQKNVESLHPILIEMNLKVLSLSLKNFLKIHE